MHLSIMSSRRSSQRSKQKKRETSPMPATGAGLMRYYDEDLPGVKIGPWYVIGFCIILIVAVLVGNIVYISPT